jgi:hypothetical protein
LLNHKPLVVQFTYRVNLPLLLSSHGQQQQKIINLI